MIFDTSLMIYAICLAYFFSRPLLIYGVFLCRYPCLCVCIYSHLYVVDYYYIVSGYVVNGCKV